MKNKRYINVKVWIIPIIGLLIAIISLPYLPEQIVLHWNSVGQADNMGSRYFILLLPLISMAVLLLGHIVPVIDPKKEAYSKFTREYTIIHVLVMIALLGGELFVIATSVGIEMNSVTFSSLLAGALIAAVGNYMPKIPQNYLTGIKSIWGYSNEEVWSKTHRMGGRLWFVSGLVMMGLALVNWNLLIVNVVIIGILLIAPRIYGMVYYRKIKGDK